MSASKNTKLKLQGYKVTDNNRARKYGIAANSLKMLKEKAGKKFSVEDVHLYLSKDGFEIIDEDYFQTLEPQTLFVIAGPDDIIKLESQVAYEKLVNNSPMIKMTEMFYQFIEKNPEKFKQMIIDYEKKPKCEECCPTDRTHLSLKNEHEDWFTESDERFRTKEEAMAKRAQDRVRSYYYRAKDEIIKNKLYRTNLKAKQIFEKIFEKFRYLLIGCDYFSMLFNRKHPKKLESIKDEIDAKPLPNKRLRQAIKEYSTKTELFDEWSVSLCTAKGDFHCQGSYSGNGVCSRNHKTNPYTTKENLILFQIWNLDHQIEMTRTIIPSIIENVRSLVENPNQKCPDHKKKIVDLSILEYFLELFSMKNLRFVHIVCHEKTSRSNKSNGRLICEDCSEYKIIKDFVNISCPEEDEDEVDYFAIYYDKWLL